MNSFIGQFKWGLKTWFSSWSFIFRHGLGHYFLYPLIISILLAMGSIALIKELVDYLMQFVSPQISYEPLDGSTWENVKSIGSDIARYAISFVIWLAAFYTTRKISKYLTLAMMSPIMALLSERTEQILTGRSYPFNGAQLVRDIFRGIGLAVRNLFMELLLVWGLLFLNFLIGWIAAPLVLISSAVVSVMIFMIGAYFYGFSTMDYCNERRKLNVRSSIHYIRKYKGVAVGNGTMFALFFYVPFVGTAIATITCTVAAALAIQEIGKYESTGSPIEG